MRSPACFAAWAVVGAGAALAVLSLLTIGVFVLAGTAVLAGLLAGRRALRGGRRQAGPGVLAGLGLPLLYVAYLNRSGPGEVCTSTIDTQACMQQANPWPWLAAGVVLTAAGVTLGLAAGRRTGRSPGGR